MRNAFGWPDRSLPGGDAHDAPPLPPRSWPLAKRSVGGVWYWACSFAQPQPWWLAEGEDHWNKRFDASLAGLLDPAQSPGRVIVEKGTYRAYHMPVYYRVADKIEWYCVGDQETIVMLLSTCTHIGKKRAQGWGRVAWWDVEPFPHDYSEWRDGAPTRALPEQLKAKAHGRGRIAHYGIRPPYHVAAHQMRVVLPL
jgi:CRISPR type IV-associated protein Csf3